MSDYDGFRLERDEARERSRRSRSTSPASTTGSRWPPAGSSRVSSASSTPTTRFASSCSPGAGGAFTAGGDIAGFLAASPWEVSQLARNVAAPERCSKLVVAALRGFVFGVGLELALACDFRIAASDIKLALPEATIGMIPGSGGSQRLARMIGLGRAKDIVMRGRRIGAEEALSLGLVTQVVEPDDLDAAVGALIDELSQRSPLAMRMAKRVLNLTYEGPLHVGLEVEGLAYGLLRSSSDFREGVESFSEKRPPTFTGE